MTTRMGTLVPSRPLSGVVKWRGPGAWRPRHRKADLDARVSVHRVDRHGPAEERRTFPQRRRTEIEHGEQIVIVVSLERETATFVGDEDAHESVSNPELQAARGGLRVPSHVHQRLVDDQTDVDPSIARRLRKVSGADLDGET